MKSQVTKVHISKKGKVYKRRKKGDHNKVLPQD